MRLFVSALAAAGCLVAAGPADATGSTGYFAVAVRGNPETRQL